ncbi:MAG TPA: ATP-dependent DNA helicase RecG [Fimbriimonas sp.]
MFERTLDTDVQFLKGVGPRAASSLRKAGLNTVGDVMYHFPRRYEDRRHLPPIAKLKPGQFATIRGRLMGIEARPTRGGMVILKATVRDETGSMALTWFNQPWIKRQLDDYRGEILAYGMVKENAYLYEIASPEWETIDEEADPDDFARIVPVYPLVEGLGQKLVRNAARAAVQNYAELVVDPLPKRLLTEIGLGDLVWCLRQIHWPDSEENRIEARRRMVFEEFFYLQVSLALKRAETQQELGISFPIAQLLAGVSSDQTEETSAPEKPNRKERSLQKAKEAFGGRTVTPAFVEPEAVPTHLFAEQQAGLREGEPLWQQVHRMLPFDLTKAQRRVIDEIWADMERPHPMNRLVQGDVGSGKTAVAACAMLAAVRSGYQAALMAPTEILAEQHANNLRRLFEPLGIEVDLLVGKQTATQKKKAYERSALGHAHIAIGTHALIQEGVQFANLGLVIVDEQHRFGVLQRKALRDKGLGNPDVLVMTATPIPRTLTMTMFGDLDLSVIDELPPGRKPVKTHWKMPFERENVYQTVRKLVQEGRQAYFVCPMVSENEKMLAQAAEDLHYRLSQQVYPDLRVGLLHGQMKPKDKEEAMERFRRHDLDVLVSTTVIEVGVDVPNSSVMVIEDANRFGLSQLHQLRGRVGRGSAQSYCVLVADAKSDEARTRMEVMVATNDGFVIAEEDLKLRGPGEMAGTRQSGNLDFKVADLVQDGRMLEVARQAALGIVEKDPTLSAPEWALTLDRIQEKRSETAVITIS